MSGLSSLNKAQKLVRILELLSRREDVAGEQLMGQFELDTRSLRRYLANLKELGVPIIDTGSGATRRIALDPSYRRSGVRFSLTEVLSLHFGRTLFTFLDGTQFASDLDDAIDRLQPAVPQADAELLGDLGRRFMAVPEHSKDYTEMGEVIDEIITSLMYSNVGEGEYARADGQRRSYMLEPYTLAVYRQALYLFARDQSDGRVKTFAVERFTDFTRMRRQNFTPPKDFDPEEFVATAFGIIGGEPRGLSLRFDARSAPYVRERSWHGSQQLEDLPDGGVRLTMDVAVSQELVTWLLGFGGSVGIEQPAELAERVLAAHKAALSRLQGQPSEG